MKADMRQRPKKKRRRKMKTRSKLSRRPWQTGCWWRWRWRHERLLSGASRASQPRAGVAIYLVLLMLLGCWPLAGSWSSVQPKKAGGAGQENGAKLALTQQQQQQQQQQQSRMSGSLSALSGCREFELTTSPEGLPGAVTGAASAQPHRRTASETPPARQQQPQQLPAASPEQTQRTTISSSSSAAPPEERARRQARSGASIGAHQMEQQDQPLGASSHSGSLAKKKLLHRIDASMVNYAQVNGKATLVCDIQAPSADDSVALILWYKDDSLAPIYTIDARKVSSLERAKSTFDEQQYSSRISFNHRTRPAQLELEQVRQDDEGEYRCRVDFRRGRTVNTIIALRVIIPPEELSIVLANSSSRGQRKLSGLIGPFNEGAQLELVCAARGGKPRPQLAWRRDFNLLETGEQSVDKEGTSASLKILSLNKSHLLSIFTCQATSSNLSSSALQSSITLDLNLKPEEVSLRQVSPTGHQQLLAGQTASFECSTHGSRPQATVHWLFQKQRHEPTMNVDQQQTSSRLQVTLERSHNSQPLTCVGQNPRIPGPAGSLSQTLKLDVRYPPLLSIKLEAPSGGSQVAAAEDDNNSNNNEGRRAAQLGAAGAETRLPHIQEGNDIYMHCQMDANPRPSKPILWRFNGRPIQLHSAESAPTFVITNQSLVLRKVTRQQSGQYTCEASNQHGSNTSRPLELNIRHAPSCITDNILVFEAAVGQTIVLDCGVLANPSKSVHFSWFASFGQSHDQRNVSDWLERDASMDEQIDESSSRLKLKIRDESQSSVLVKCKAKNEVGLQQKACHFQVTRAMSPTLRHSCSLASERAKHPSTSLLVSCKPNEHLKTDQFQMELASAHSQGSPGPAPGPLAGSDEPAGFHSADSGLAVWWPFRARANQSLATAAKPQRRLLLAPSWLLAELYKQPKAGQQQQTSSSEPASGYELSAYVLVALQEQLARIKTLVEENKLFKEQPRDIYYVAARPNSLDWQSGSSSNVSAHTSRQRQRQQSFLMPPALGGNNQDVEEEEKEEEKEFQFTVPSLESGTRYKLLIFGQNLANKTRDWLVVRGETANEDDLGGPKDIKTEDGYDTSMNDGSVKEAMNRNNKAQLHSSLASSSDLFKLISSNLSSGELADSSSASSPGRAAQKSLVMRSGEQETSDNSPPQDSQDPSSSAEAAQSNLSLSSMELDKSLSAKRNSQQQQQQALEFKGQQLVEQLAAYKEHALAYARSRPLLAVPVALVGCLMLSLLLIYLVGTFVGLLRKRLASQQANVSRTFGGQLDQDAPEPGGFEDHQPQKCSPGELDKFQLGREDTASKSASNSHTSGANSSTSNQTTTATNCSTQSTTIGFGCEMPGANYQQPMRMLSGGSNLMLPPAFDHCSRSPASLGSMNSSSPPDENDSNHPAGHMQFLQEGQQLYAIDTSASASADCGQIQLSAIALEPLGEAHFALQTSTGHQNRVYPISEKGLIEQQQHSFNNFLGSLDRRWPPQQQQPDGLVQLQQEDIYHHQHHFGLRNEPQCRGAAANHHHHVRRLSGSMDRRQKPASCVRQQMMMASSTQQRPHRVVAFDLGSNGVQFAGKSDSPGTILNNSLESSLLSGATNAADSGHESPGIIISSSNNNNNNHTKNDTHHMAHHLSHQPVCRRHVNQQQQVQSVKARPRKRNIDKNNNNNNLAHQTATSNSSQESPSPSAAGKQLNGSNCQLMLMEMSPGSQEESSGTTLLHSVDCSSSFGSSQMTNINFQPANNYAFLQPNHEIMATSFASSQAAARHKINGAAFDGIDETDSGHKSNWL